MPLADYPFADSIGAGSSVVAPGAGAGFCTLAAPPAGWYEIVFSWELVGTAETAVNNVKLKYNAANQITGLPSHSGIGPTTRRVARALLDGVNGVQLAVTNAATGGAVYNGDIQVTRIG